MLGKLKNYLLKPWLQASCVATIAFAVYVHTLAPTVMWYDMGEFATGAYVLGIAHNTGYPLFMLLGKLFTFIPLGDAAYRVNLMSAFFAALTVLVVYLIVYRLTNMRTAAIIGALTLAFTSTLWSNATWAESYDVNAFLTVFILYQLMRWMETNLHRHLYVSTLVFGLSLGNHRLILGVAPVMVYLILYMRLRKGVRLQWRHYVMLGLLFVIGFSVNLYIPIRAAQNPPVNWGDLSDFKSYIKMITTGYASPETFVNPFVSANRFLFWLMLLTIFPMYELTAVGILIAAVGALFLYRKDRPLFMATLIIILFAAVIISIYGIHNIFNYFQPIYLMAGIWLGCGTSHILAFVDEGLSRSIKFRFTFLTPNIRVLLAALLLLIMPLLLLSRNFRILDRSQDRNASYFADYLLSNLQKGSVVLADFWSWTPLLYAQVVEGKGEMVFVSPFLSMPGLDQEEILDDLLREGAHVYIAVGAEDSHRLEISHRRLQLVAPHVIHYYPTHGVPLPKFKDILVPRGAVYKALDDSPDLLVESVPSEYQLEVDFEGGIQLLGFHIDRTTLTLGEVFQATYYWSISDDTETEYWVDILFTDEGGNVVTTEGIPIWLHSHWIGGGAHPTSDWNPGDIVREVLDGLVPSGVDPGMYYIRAYLYEDPARVRSVPILGSAPGKDGVLLGTVEVVDQ